MQKNTTVINIVGNKYGRLKVLERVLPNYYTPKNKQMTRWKCQCDCGKIVIKTKGTLTSGNTKSCGCLKAEQSPKNTKHIKDSSLKRLFTLYQYSAKKRNFSFELTRKEFNTLILGDCFYCNKKPSTSIKFHKNGIPILYSGIDRINSFVGYKKENCVSCCKNCNTAKMQLSTNEFYNMIKNIYNNLKKKNLI